MTESMGERIRKLRETKDWTQKQLGYSVGLSVTTIGKLERDRLDPRGQTVQTLASVLGCSVPHLWYGNTGWWARLFDRWPVLEPVQPKGMITETVDVPQTVYGEDRDEEGCE